MYCQKCGYKNADNARYCRRCGTYIWIEEPAEEAASETVANEEMAEGEKAAANKETIDEAVAQGEWQPDAALEPIETKIEGTTGKFHVAAIVACVAGILVVAGLIVGCVLKNGRKQEEMEAAADTEVSTEIVETTAATTEQTIDMSSYQAQLDQWKAQFAAYTMTAATQPTYDATVAQYEAAIAGQNVDGCNQCEATFTSLFEQVKQENYVVTVRRNYYANVLERLYFYDTLPDDGDDIETKMADDYETYAVYDIDGDGIEELMLYVNRPGTGSSWSIIYEYNVDTDSLKQELYAYMDNQFYSNGRIVGMDDFSHGVMVYVYNPENDDYSDSYLTIMRGTTYWDMGSNNEDHSGYDYRVYHSNTEEETYMTEEEYNQWLADQTAGATEIEIPWKKIVDEEYREYAKAYSAMMLENVKAHLQEGQNDIGVSYIEGGDSCEAAETMLSSIMAVSYDDESGDMVIGSLDGKEFYIGSREDATGVIYQKKAIDNLTLLGLYPGMKKEDAVALIKEYGFHKFSDHAYCTGDAFGSYAIYLDCKKGKVKSIQLNPFCGFAG